MAVPNEFVALRSRLTRRLRSGPNFRATLSTIFQFIDGQTSFLEQNLENAKKNPEEFYGLVYTNTKLMRTLLLSLMDLVGMTAAADQQETDLWWDSSIYDKINELSTASETEEEIAVQESSEDPSDKLDSPS